MSSDEILHYLDWEIDEGWVAAPGPHGVVQFVPGDWGKVSMFQIVPGSLSLTVEEDDVKPRREFPILWVMAALSVPFWLLAGYGLYCLVSR